MIYNKLSNDQLKLVADTIRVLSAEGVDKANSGHPGAPMGMAELATVLWLKYLNFNPRDPKWINRDRFILSNGHGSMLIYSLLHLFGYDLSMDDIKAFRQWGSKTPGHPENFITDGVECTTGPLGQGISNSVGMATARNLMAARYNSDAAKIFTNKTFVFAGDGCLMEGVSSEASSLAGHLGLNDLVVIYDDNHISIAGNTNLAFTEDVCARYEAYGWATKKIDGHSFKEIDEALTWAQTQNKPVLIAARTIIGKGSPNKADSYSVHGSPLGADELQKTKDNIGWKFKETFFVPEEVQKVCAQRLEELSSVYGEWTAKFDSWSTENPELAKKLNAQINFEVPADLTARLVSALPKDKAAVATRKLSQIVLQEASKNSLSLIGGSADLEPSTLTLISGSEDVQKGKFSGLNLRFGVREHAMGSFMNGLSYYGGFTPYGSTFLVFSDYMRPTVRLAALSHLRGLFIYTHDSFYLGEDGPTHQPIEHLNSLRMIPNLWVMRPADGVETAVCYSLALKRKDGPALFSLTRQNLPEINSPENADTSNIEKGGYIVRHAQGEPDYVFVATGSEVGLALKTVELGGFNAQVVSVPCFEIFKSQSVEYRESVIPGCTGTVKLSKPVRKVTLEAGSTFGWRDLVGGSNMDTLCIGIDRFGASAPDKVLAEKFGFVPEKVVERVNKFFN